MFTCEMCHRVVKGRRSNQKCARCCRLLKEKGINPSKKKGERKNGK
jgi:hypothetical protein